MKHVVILGMLAALCLAALAGVVAQHTRLARLRVEQQRLLSDLSVPEPANAPPRSSDAEVNAAGNSSRPASLEILKLRREVGRLIEQRNALSAVTNEHARLLAEVANRRANLAGTKLPEGYLRKTQARLVGFDSPEHTLQSFLWAIQNRDLGTLSRVFTPAMARSMSIPVEGQPSEDYFRDMGAMPGLAVVNRQVRTDEAAELEVQIAPGGPTMTLSFQWIDGQWRIDKPF